MPPFCPVLLRKVVTDCAAAGGSVPNNPAANSQAANRTATTPRRGSPTMLCASGIIRGAGAPSAIYKIMAFLHGDAIDHEKQVSLVIVPV